MKLETFKKIKLPDKPGVYFFKHKKQILYIGKATSLRDRTKSYFSNDLIDTRGPLIVDMVHKASKIEWQVTDSVLEALILEANLIKKYLPKHNTDGKSDRSFNYVCITKEELPKVVVVRGKELNDEKNSPAIYSKIFGPYPNGGQLQEAIKMARKIFPFLDDKSKNYIEFYKQINLVPDLNDTKLYKQNIKNIILFFSGKKQQIFRNLKKEMNAYSKTREFEKAGEIKRQLFALQHINDVALIKNERKDVGIPQGGSPTSATLVRIEAYDIAHLGGKNMVGVMVVVGDGEVDKNEYRKFKIRTQSNANDIGALKEVLERRLAHTEWPHPSLVVVDGGVAQINIAKTILKKLKLNIPLVSVLKDEHHKPKAIMGTKKFAVKYKREILLANSEAHRFAITYHKKMRNKNFLA